MKIMGIDPGTKESAFVVIDPSDMSVHEKDHIPNEELRDFLNEWHRKNMNGWPYVACEGIQSYGMSVGKETFETCYWIGRYWELCHGTGMFTIVYRKDIKLHLCQTTRAKEPNVRQALLDRYEPTGGGKNPKIGIKKQPGPLFGMANHLWSALAVAVYFKEVLLNKKDKESFGEFSF